MILYIIKHVLGTRAILHFGIGLIGSAFKKRMEQLFTSNLHLISCARRIDWNNQQRSSNIIAEFIDENRQTIAKAKCLSILWTAGKMGFNGTTSNATQEFDFFKVITNLLYDKCLDLIYKKYFILVSSSGGIYEGQIRIKNKSNYSPKRAYGELKVSQEKIISQLFKTPIFVRLSSVYSKTNVDSRLGLIGTLLTNGLNNQVTTINGSAATLRDYILDDDIADALIKIINSLDETPIHFFASGNSISISTLIRFAERFLHKKLYINYSYNTTNSLNMAYNENIISRHFKNSDIKVNIKQLLINLLK